MAFKQEKVSSALRNTAASFIKSKSIYGAIITVTRVELSRDLRKAKISISVFPEEKEREVLKIMNTERGALRNYIKSHLRMKFLPHFEIEIDKSEKNRQRIEEMLKDGPRGEVG